MDDMDSELSGHITVSVASHVVSPLFDQTLQYFHSEYPEVSFKISVSDSQSVIRRVQHKQASLGICLVEAKEDSLDYQLMYRQYFGFSVVGVIHYTADSTSG